MSSSVVRSRRSSAILAAGLGWLALLPSGAAADEWTLEHRLQPLGRPAERREARVGAAVCLEGDVLILGAPRWRSGEVHGAAEVHRFNGLAWVLENRILSRSPDPSSSFGAAVAQHGGHLAIGAPDQDPAGAVFLYRMDGGDWLFEQLLLPAAGSGAAGFGSSLSLHDGLLAVGMPNATTTEPFTGAVQTFDYDGLFWEPSGWLTRPEGETGDRFGHDVSLHGRRLLVGAPQADSAGDRAGDAWLFVRDEAGWHVASGLAPRGLRTGDAFGSAVALHGTRALVGAPGDDSVQVDTGAAHLFRIDEERLRAEPLDLLLPLSEAREYGFGSALGMSEGTLAVAASGSVPPAANAAILHVYQTVEDRWTEVERLLASPGQQSSLVYTRVGVSDDTVVAGTPMDELAEHRSGTASIFRARKGRSWSFSDQQRLAPDVWSRGNELGRCVQLVGSLAYVGMPGDSEDEPDGGAVHLFERDDGRWRLAQRLVPPQTRRGLRFGSSLFVEDDRMFVGAPGGEGEVHEFERSEGAWRAVRVFRRSQGHERDAFGATVHARGSLLAVGAPGCWVDHPQDRRGRPTAEGAGAVYLYSLEPPEDSNDDANEEDTARGGEAASPSDDDDDVLRAVDPKVPVRIQGEGDRWLTLEDRAPAAAFGSAIEMTDDTLYVGAPGAGDGLVVEYQLSEQDVVWRGVRSAPRSRKGGRYGSAIAADEQLLAIGAPGSISRGGELWLYSLDLPGDEPQLLRPGLGRSARGFGSSVDLGRDLVVVGAIDVGASEITPGGVWVFTRDGDRRWHDRGVLGDRDGVVGDRLGHCVSLSGRRVLAGSPQAHAGRGGALVFHLNELPSTGLLFSLSTSTALPDGRIAGRADLLYLDRRRAIPEVFFDASDVLPLDTQIDALCVHPDGSLVLSFEGEVRLPGLIGGPAGDWVDGSDLVLFRAESWGADTRGRFEFWLDGSDLGLQGPDEDIDGVSLDENLDIHLSLRGAFQAGELSSKREAILLFEPEQLGADTAGRLSLLLDGRDGDVRLAATTENVDAYHFRAGAPHLVFSTEGVFRVPGVPEGSGAELLVFRVQELGLDPNGVFDLSFTAEDIGLGPVNIDALHLFD